MLYAKIIKKHVNTSFLKDSSDTQSLVSICNMQFNKKKLTLLLKLCEKLCVFLLVHLQLLSPSIIWLQADKRNKPMLHFSLLVWGVCVFGFVYVSARRGESYIPKRKSNKYKGNHKRLSMHILFKKKKTFSLLSFFRDKHQKLL